MSWVLLMLGGALGTAARHGLALAGKHWFGSAWFPVGTFAANALGSFALAIVWVTLEGKTVFGADARLVFGTGAMGGFTTYSTFNLEVLRLMTEGHAGRALAYVITTVLVCLLAGWLGFAVAR